MLGVDEGDEVAGGGPADDSDSSSSDDDEPNDAADYELVSRDDANAPLGPMAVCH